MRTSITTIGEISGKTTGGLPNRKIVRDAQKNLCLSAEFWTRIKNGKIPYIFDRTKNSLAEAGYADVPSSLRGQFRGDMYWLTDEEFPNVNETLQNIAGLETMKKSYQEQISKYKK